MQKVQNFWFLLSATLNRMRKCETRKAKFSHRVMAISYGIISYSDGSVLDLWWRYSGWDVLNFSVCIVESSDSYEAILRTYGKFHFMMVPPLKAFKVTIMRTRNRKYDLPTRGGKIWPQGWTIDFETLRGSGKIRPLAKLFTYPLPEA